MSSTGPAPHAAPRADGIADGLTVLILTFNEAANIARTLEAVSWASRILIVDSGSTDETVAIARHFARVEVVTRAFDSHQAQWSYGLSLCEGGNGWVLALAAPVLLVMDFWVVRREERHLEAKFGEDYLRYKAAVRRWL